MSEETVIAWTRQVPQVLEEIESTGRYLVREEYVRAKNGAISDYYLELYRWYTEGCRSRCDIPEDATLPIWLALTQAQRLGAAPGTISLTLEIPRSNLFIVDYDKWGYRVNHWYVPVDEADEKRHNEELAKQGISNEAMLITTDRGNFYPLMKRKIMSSWNRIFDGPNERMDLNVGTIWEIKPEWIKEVEVYDEE